MKILFCLHHFLPEHVAGTEIYTLRLAQNLQLLGNEVVVVIPNFGSIHTIEYQFESIRIIKYSEVTISDRDIIMGKKQPEGLKDFANVLLAEQPDVIHFHELSPGRGINVFHVQKAAELHFSVVLTFHLASYSCFKGSLVYKDETRCDGIVKIKRCTECVYQSKNITGAKAKLLINSALALYYLNINPTILNSTLGTALGFPFVIQKIKKDLFTLSHLAKKIVVLTNWYKDVLERNGIPPEKLKFIEQGLTNEIPENILDTAIDLPLRVVFIGRISEVKGLHILIDAICNLPEDKISLYIYGPETEKGYAEICKQKTVAKKNVHWLGPIAPDKVIITLSQYHLLCLPSAFEMSPLVIKEAFAAGLPVIASRVYGNEEQIIDGTNGWLFHLKDSNDLTEKLKLLIADLSLIEKAKLVLPTSNTFSNIASEHIKMYSEILNEQTPIR